MHKFKNVLKCFLPLGLATGVSAFFFNHTHSSGNIMLLYMLAIIIISKITPGYLWGILSAVAGVICVNYFFTAPYLQLDFLQKGYPLTFLGMLTISATTSAMTSRIDTQKKDSSDEKNDLKTLMHFNNKLLNTHSREEMLSLAILYLSELNHASVLYWKNDKQTQTSSCPTHFHGDDTLHIFRQKVLSRQAEFIFEQPAFGNMDNHFHRYYYLPAASSDVCYGIFFIAISTAREHLSLNPLTHLMVPQIVLSLEHSSLFEHHHELRLETEKEKMRATLLRAISHDLRTPLTGIIGSSSAYLDASDVLTPSEKTKLVSTIRSDADWLLHMVENLLSVTRIHQETSKVAMKEEPLEEVVAEAVCRFQRRYPTSLLEVNIPADFLFIPMDATLIEQVIINLLENAVLHSGSRKTINFHVEISDEYAYFHVRDYGKGIPCEALSDIFNGSIITDRNSSPTHKGMGIGLSICKTIIQAHGGTIEAINRNPGVDFIFALPLKGEVTNAATEAEGANY